MYSRGEITYNDDYFRPIKKTLNHYQARLEDVEYVAREFERYREIEIINEGIDKRSISNRRADINRRLQKQ